MSARTCNHCGWVAFGVTRAFAEEEVARFNAYFDTMDQEGKDMFGGKPSDVAHYERCRQCGGGYMDFQPAVQGDCPTGCTLAPIIVE